ncbi:hypothetical protein BG55_15325 [Erwinia mallotivora]|uniref:Uncharacterized protein n=1 Tax=Erwinia mallotivora TaxID=69222 RepID=A0A014PV55_9GAMM|nr:hypothetical protein BG55_15325 [Erwinia mallotivora]
MGITPQQPGNNRDHRRTNIKPRKSGMLWHGPGFLETLITHHSHGKADICQLHQHQTKPEVIADFVIANDCRPRHRKQGADQVAKADTTTTEQIINQRNIERRHHGEQQQLRYAQVKIGLETDQIHDPQLQSAHRHIEQQSRGTITAPAQKG